jgi:hypothetical protein
MGWCSGTEIFDNVADIVLPMPISKGQKLLILGELKTVMEDHDWDCQSDSDYYSDPAIGPLLGNTFED